MKAGQQINIDWTDMAAAAARAGVEQDSNRTDWELPKLLVWLFGVVWQLLYWLSRIWLLTKRILPTMTPISLNIGQLQRRRIHQHLFTLLPIIKVNPVILFLWCVYSREKRGKFRPFFRENLWLGYKWQNLQDFLGSNIISWSYDKNDNFLLYFLCTYKAI